MLRTSQSGRIAESGGRMRQRIADPSPGDRRGVRQQTEGRRLEWIESETNQKRSGNRHRRAASAGPLQKGSETEGDQDQLQSLVRGEVGDRILHDLELPGLDRDIVEEHRGDDDPRNPEKAEDHPVHRGGADHHRRHAEDQQRQQNRHDHSPHGRDPDPLL
jgi:uncharacterized sporulation protein YeaH/YhbH (DUF444 family)